MFVLAALALWCEPLRAEQSLEYQVKAAFLLNFTKFIEWPPATFSGSDAPFSICILGDDPFGPVLDRIVDGETVNGRRLAIHRINRPVPQFCQILFVRLPEPEVSSVIRGLGPGVLTVGEGSSFLKDGGVIAFFIENRRVRFDISQTAAASAGLRVSSKLLKVARTVQR